MLVFCSKYKIKIEQNYKDHCQSCIFYRQKKDVDGYIYLVCDFDSWIPGLIRGKND